MKVPVRNYAFLMMLLSACGTAPNGRENTEVRGDEVTIVDPTIVVQPGSTERQWQGEYFNNNSLQGNPVFRSGYNVIDFDWGTGSPRQSVINSDNFSARFTWTGSVQAGDYTIKASSDDGIKVWVDQKLVIDDWTVHAVKSYSHSLWLAQGSHKIVIEYKEHTGEARLTFGMQRGSGSGTVATTPLVPDDQVNIVRSPWQAEYFDNATLAGRSSRTATEEVINYDWGKTGPGALGFKADNFSIRWTQVLTLPAGRYELKAVSDDGIRVAVDGKLVIDSWTVHAVKTDLVSVNLGSGQHRFVVEYFEKEGNAVAKFSYRKTN